MVLINCESQELVGILQAGIINGITCVYKVVESSAAYGGCIIIRKGPGVAQRGHVVRYLMEG